MNDHTWNAITDAVRDAGAIIRRHWHQDKNVRYKGAIDLVTETDLAVEEALKGSLSGILPEADFLAEETAASRKPGRLTWIIDPVDGTTNYAHSIPAVAVSVALWRKDRVEAGWVYLPMMGRDGELFSARRGGGAFLNGEPIRVSDTAALSRSVIATGFPYSIRDKLEEIMPRVSRVLAVSQGIRRFGSAATDLVYTAMGRFDGFFEQDLNPWDVAAGWLVVEEAGGRVTEYDPAEPYALGAKKILATNGRIHEELEKVLRDKDGRV
jgi:myo-inositol-1(or 4)-monophosphatase